MATTYELCEQDSDENAMVNRILEKWHPDVAKTRPWISVIFASNDEGPDLKLHGYPCAAVIKQNSYKDRVAGKADVDILVSREWWDDNPTDEAREALLDRELCHLEVKLDKNGEVVTDDLDRPRFTMRLHDFEFGGFYEVIRRHKQLAVEAQQMVKFLTQADGQMLIGWAENTTDGDRIPLKQAMGK